MTQKSIKKNSILSYKALKILIQYNIIITKIFIHFMFCGT